MVSGVVALPYTPGLNSSVIALRGHLGVDLLGAIASTWAWI